MTDEVVAEARQGILQLVRLLRLTARFLSERLRSRAAAPDVARFAQWFDQRLPGLREEVARNPGLDDAQLADRFDTRFGPQWAGQARQVVDAIPSNHPIYADPDLRQARQAYDDPRNRLRGDLARPNPERRLRGDLAGRDAPGRPAQDPAATRPARAALGDGLMAARARLAAGAARDAVRDPQRPPDPADGPAFQPPTPAQQPTPAQSGAADERPGYVRTLVAAKEGPIVLTAEMLGRPGKLVVKADKNCKQATVTVRTDLVSEPSVDAIRAVGVLKQRSDGGLAVSVPSPDEMSAASSMSYTDGAGNSFTFNNYGAVGTQIAVNNGDLYLNGATAQREPAPIEITAVVPEGSVVMGRTGAASIETAGRLGSVDVKTHSGTVEVGSAAKVYAISNTGDVGVRDLGGDGGGWALAESQSGAVTVHATTGGGVRASSMSGSVTVTATAAALDQGLGVDASSTTGMVSTPKAAERTGAHRADGTTGARDFRDRSTPQQRTGVRDL